MKKEVNDLREENKLLKNQQEKYKKRAEYAKAKFYEVKDKEHKEPVATESQYRLKNSELKLEIKKITEEK